MQGRPLRKLVLLALVAGVVAAVVKALRGEPAPQFSTHPSVTGGPVPDPTPAPVAAPVPPPSPTPLEQTAADEASTPETSTPETPADETEPVAAAADDDARQSWVAPVDGGCPDGYPVKAKLSSGIFHVPGGLAYDRTKPDRCYPSAAAAEADGLRASKR